MFMVLSIQPGQESQKTMLDSQLLSFDCQQVSIAVSRSSSGQIHACQQVSIAVSRSSSGQIHACICPDEDRDTAIETCWHACICPDEDRDTAIETCWQSKLRSCESSIVFCDSCPGWIERTMNIMLNNQPRTSLRNQYKTAQQLQLLWGLHHVPLSTFSESLSVCNNIIMQL